MGLAKLFEFRTEVEEYKEVPWESEATEELLEDIVEKKYEKYKKTYPTMAKELEERKNKVLKVAKDFVKMCRKIGGKPKVREYASRYFGTIDMVCHLDDVEKITSVWYDNGVLSVTTEKGTGSMHLPKGLDKVDMKLKDVDAVEEIEFSNHITTYFGVKRFVEGFMKPEKIELDIYDDHVKMIFRSKEEIF